MPSPSSTPPVHALIPAGLQEIERQLAQINVWIRTNGAVGPWQPLALGTKWERYSASFQEPAARRESTGGTVRLRGVLKVKAAETYTIGETVFTVPEGFTPPDDVDLVTIVPSVASAILRVALSGVANVAGIAGTSTIAAGGYLLLDGLTYNLT